ncbi:hypothetical protein IEQ_04966 [Bacillus cereus BAG6X1-2]|nr:hypothetical protein IEQ_04966 [Bacillus cereus BAG6X1-2]
MQMKYYICPTCKQLQRMFKEDFNKEYCGHDGSKYIKSCPGCDKEILSNTSYCEYCGTGYFKKKNA